MSIYNRASVMAISTARILSQGWQSHCFGDEAREVAATVMSLHTLGAIVSERCSARQGGDSQAYRPAYY